MKFWVISPNVSADSAEQPLWKKIILEKEIVLMGWDEDHQLGWKFKEEVKLGDFVLVAQGANRQKRLFIGGVVSSNASWEKVEGAPREAYFRKLSPVLSKSELDDLRLDFNKTAYGDADRIPALYVLHPDKNNADKQLSDQLKAGIISKIKAMEIDEKIRLLRYKKQIILQGPPGTGKTKLAKEIAGTIIGVAPTGFKRPDITDHDIVETLKGVSEISTVAGKAEYRLIKVDTISKTITLKKSTDADAHTNFEKVKEFYKDKFWEKNTSSNDDRRAAAIAQFIYSKLQQEPTLENSAQFKLIQFHPSYSYEDFVRGIVAKPNPDGEGVVYEAENKLLAAFSKLALSNYILSLPETSEIDSNSDLERFVSYVIEKIDVDEKFPLTDNVYILYVDSKRFKYKGDSWTGHPNGLNMNFSELEKIIASQEFSRPQINKNQALNELTRQHATYYVKLLEKFQEFLKNNPAQPKEKPTSKDYVLVIDEINRANLSSVLGELIYALEYRGEKVESMYAVDDSNELILPPNLYIIGTMNTADRSVGHIDYAIRRRFAFVDVSPKDLSDELGDKFHKELFDKVAVLFSHETNLSAEFDAKDVQLGHSYFIDKSEEGGTIEIRLQFEIKPILMEYVKDGILIGNVANQTISEHILSL